MRLRVLGSSSKGNCYILETDTGSLILDCGVRFPDIQKALGFDLSRVVGCLVTHVHQDHSKAVRDLLRAGIDVYGPTNLITQAKDGTGHRLFTAYVLKKFEIGEFVILPFDAQHDVPCVGYLIVYKPTGEKLVYLTDSYYSKYKFTGVHYYLLECNYITDILKANIEAGAIPESLKNRLIESHFSLDNVKGFLRANDLSEVCKIVLIHLSDGNSDAARMVREITELTGKDTVAAEAGMEIELEQYPF